MFNTKQPPCCDKSSPFISKSSCVFHKTLHFKNPHVFSQNTSFYIKHLNPSNYKTCLYNLFVYLYTKNTKDPPVFFHKNTTFFKTIKPVYTTYLCVFTQKIPKTLLCFFTKTLHFISKHLNPSNYKTCLYNLFVCLYTKNTKDPPVFFHKNTTFHIKTLKSE